MHFAKLTAETTISSNILEKIPLLNVGASHLPQNARVCLRFYLGILLYAYTLV